MRQDWHRIVSDLGWYRCKDCGQMFYDPEMSIMDQYMQDYRCPDCQSDYEEELEDEE